mmetsp:Transcript_89716/g.179224  ORF Transcript_89716/g.179224 Transcript_89716/m.179224 type:complete len:853 (+) Transcript_89716:68-2626(+)
MGATSVALPHFPNKHTRSKYTKKLVWRYVPVLSPAQYWHRIEAGKIILAANEREDALKNVRRLRPRSVALLCPPELQGTWDRYHREFGDIPRSSCGQCLDEGVLRTSRSITTACNTPTVGKFEDPTLVLNRLAEQLGKKNLHPKEVRPHKRTIRRSSSVPDDEQPGECKQENDGIKFQTNNDALHTGRTRFMTGVRAKYVANHHIGRMPQRTLRYLREAADNQLDYPENPLHDWEYLEDRLDSPSLQFYLMVLQRLRTTRLPVLNWAISHFCRTQVFNQLALTQEVAAEYVYARGELSVKELLDNEAVALAITSESDRQLKKVLHYMHRNMEWPEISNALKTRTASRQLLMYHKRIVDELLEDGAISEREYEVFTDIAEQMLRKVHMHPVSEEARSLKNILIEGVPGPRNIQTKLSLMNGIEPEDIRGFLAHREPNAVMFREVFVRPHVKLFEKDEMQVHGSDDQSIRGRRGWFVLVRGMVRREETCTADGTSSVLSVAGTEDGVSSTASSSWDCNRILLEPGSMIGLVEQLLGEPMTASYTTSSFCHLIFMDSAAYLKEASLNTDSMLYKSLFKTMASEVLPKLLKCPLITALPLENECVFVEVIEETLRIPTSESLGLPIVDPVVKHSDSFCDLNEIAAVRRERSFSVFPQKKAQAVATGDDTTGSWPMQRQHVVILRPEKWYALLRGSVLGGSAVSPDSQRLHLLAESIRTLASAVAANKEAAAQKKTDLVQLNGILASLIEQNGSSGLIEKCDAPTLLCGLDGRVSVSARAVILELPDVFKGAHAANNWLDITRRHNFDLLNSPRSSRRVLNTDDTRRHFQMDEDLKTSDEWDDEGVGTGVFWDMTLG